MINIPIHLEDMQPHIQKITLWNPGTIYRNNIQKKIAWNKRDSLTNTSFRKASSLSATDSTNISTIHPTPMQKVGLPTKQSKYPKHQKRSSEKYSGEHQKYNGIPKQHKPS